MLTLLLCLAGASDLRHRKIPNGLTLLMVCYGIVFDTAPLAERIVGGVIFLPFFLLAMCSEKMKGGDIKFLAALSWCVGIVQLMRVLIFAVVYACAYTIVKKESSGPLAFFVLAGWLTVQFTNLLYMFIGGTLC